MKPKDLVALVVALVLLVGVGYFYLNQNSSKKTTAAATTANQAEVAPVIPSQLDPNNTLTKMSTTYQVRDYQQPVNISSGLGNPAPFGQ